MSEKIFKSKTISIWKKNRFYTIEDRVLNDTVDLYPTRTTYKFDKYVIPQFKNYLKPVIDKHHALLFEIWKELILTTVTFERLTEIIDIVYEAIANDLYENINSRQLQANTKKKTNDIVFDQTDNIAITFVSDFLKLLFPLFVFEKYYKPFIERSMTYLRQKDNKIDTVFRKIIDVINTRVKILFATKKAYFSYLQHAKQIDDVIFMTMVYSVLGETIPFAYDTTNTIGYVLTMIERNIRIRFLETIAKIVQHYDYIEYHRETGALRQYKSMLLDLDISLHIAPFVENTFDNEVILTYKNTFPKMWPYMKFIIIPYLIKMGYDYSHITMARELYYVPLALHKILENKFDLFSQILISKRIKHIDTVAKIPIHKNYVPQYIIDKFGKLIYNLHEIYGVYENIFTGKQFTINNNNLVKVYVQYLKKLWNTEVIQLGYLKRDSNFNNGLLVNVLSTSN